MPLKVSDDEFIAAWRQGGASPSGVARLLGVDLTSVYRRRASLAKKGLMLSTVVGGLPNGSEKYGWQAESAPYRQRVDFTVKDGCAVFFGDCHWWPGKMSLANQALLILLKRLKPKLVCANGDVFDGAGISRHEPLGWVKLPKVIEELDIVKQRLWEIQKAVPVRRLDKPTEWYLSPGNHCTRFDRRLATEVSEFEGVPGMRIEDHLKGWKMAYVGVINKDADVPVLVMHNFKGGIHATWNNAIHAGATIVTGHLHTQARTAHSDYFKTKYGIDHGMLADPKHAAFSYTMGRPTNWRSGFAVIEFDEKGRHLPPSLCEVQAFEGYQRAVYHGEVICEEKLEVERKVTA